MIACSFVAILLLNTCKNRDSRSVVKVSGGEIARVGQFPATVAISGCTATKIAPRHFLTAAHCVVDDSSREIDPDFAVGNVSDFYFGPDLTTALKIPLTIVRTSVHASYIAELSKFNERGTFKVTDEILDLAMIEVKEFTPAIQTALYEDVSPYIDQPIIIQGYGCEFDYVRKMWEEEMAGNNQILSKENPKITGSDAKDPSEQRKLNWTDFHEIKSVDKYIFRIAFSKFPNNKPKACPGDSGGAVFINDLSSDEEKEKHQYLRLIGVNSRVGMFDNTFARVDDSAEVKIRSCIQKWIQGRPTKTLHGISLLCEESGKSTE